MRQTAYFFSRLINNLKKEQNEELARLGRRIKQLRLQNGCTNYEFLAFDHVISRALFNYYEQSEDLRYTSLVKVVKAFSMTIKEFFNEGVEQLLAERRAQQTAPSPPLPPFSAPPLE